MYDTALKNAHDHLRDWQEEVQTVLGRPLPDVDHLIADDSLSLEDKIALVLNECQKLLVTVPKTIIGFVGDRGAGKSTLINKLLANQPILPFSGDATATAAITEIVGWDKNYYNVTIKFIPAVQWSTDCADVRTSPTSQATRCF